MSCQEVAVFQFKKDCLEGAVLLNKQLIKEMQEASNGALLSFEVLQSMNNPSIFTWLIEWTTMEAAKATTDQWLSFPSNKKFSSSVEKDIFYDFLERQ